MSIQKCYNVDCVNSMFIYFIGKYCEFHKLYSEKKYKEAAKLLISLIASEIASPK